jgi:hypothetical protein
MLSNRKPPTITIALIASLLFTSVTLFAQTTAPPSGDWSRVAAVETKSKLIVKLKNGKTVEGKLSNVSDAGLTLSVKDKPVDVKREDVLSVYQLMKKSAAKATLIGMGLGAGVGAGVGLAAGGNDSGFEKIDHAATAGLTVLGAAGGAAVGYLMGKSGRKPVLIYQASQP